MRLTLEMRIMGGSGVTMAPQYGNDLGTCSYNVLSNLAWNVYKGLQPHDLPILVAFPAVGACILGLMDQRHDGG
jgi:hypothetical protein